MPLTIDRVRDAFADRFDVEREMHRGAMAIVFLARDRARDRLVALKVLRPEFAITVGAERFHREIGILGSLEHPNILPMLEAATAGTLLYYVTPCASDDLATRIAREVRLSLEDTLSITRQVADALDYAHARNVLHRDIKPSNVLFDGERAEVCDFGIARAIEVAAGESLSSSGLIVGTPTYMSPEQARHDREIDGRADIYSLGCVVYEMLVGQPPFTGPTVQAVLARHTKERPPKIRVIRPEVPEHVEAAVEAALAKDPAARPNTGASLVSRLSG